jgi:osmotically inducible lipoprotein OsmB
MSRVISMALLLTGVGLSLAGCGDTVGQRAGSGGLIGAGTGAAIAAVTGGPVLGAALVGGAVGAVGGAVTTPGRH